MKNFVIVGSGRQGIAVAYDLLRDKNHHVTIVDISNDSIDYAFKKLSMPFNVEFLELLYVLLYVFHQEEYSSPKAVKAFASPDLSPKN